MAKISTYPIADEPLLLSDRLIGTEAIRPIPSTTPLATKNFSLQELLDLFSSNFPAATLQAVLNAGNIATQDIFLTGTIDVTSIKPIDIEDFLGSKGTTFQYLSKASTGINWVDLPVDNLQSVLNAGNTATQNINLTGDITSTKIIPGNIQDDTSSIGTAGQVLSKTVSGIRWITNPTSYTAGLNDVLLVGNTATNNINLIGDYYGDNFYTNTGGYGLQDDGTLLGNAFQFVNGANSYLNYGGLTFNTWTLPNQSGTIALTSDIPSALTLTTIGTSGPATLINNVLNVPIYGGTTTPTLDEVLTAGNTSLLDANIGQLGLWDSVSLAYMKIIGIDNAFTFVNSNLDDVFYTEQGILTLHKNNTISSTIDNNLLTINRNYSLPDASGTIALTSDIPSLAGYVPTSRTLTINGTTYDLSANRTWSVGTVTSVGLTMPVAFSVSNSPITGAGDIAVTAVGTSAQYIRGDGQLATFPTSGGGGSSVTYYLNGSVPSSVAGYQQMDNDAIIGLGTDFNLVGNGLIAQFLTDAGNPNRIEIPSGAWNFEIYFNISSVGGNTKFYVDLLKYDGSTFTLISSGSTNPEEITGGTSVDLYLTSLAIPTTPLLITDRLAIRVYIVDNSGGRTVTLHTEDNNLCEIITTFSSGVASLNGLTASTQYFAVGTSGMDFNISSLVDTHTFNLPTSSATVRGALSSADWTAFNSKFTLPSLTLGSVLFSDGTTIAQDNANFFWDNANNRLGIGTATPNFPLHVKGDILLETSAGTETIWMSGGSAVRYSGGKLILQNSISIDSNNGYVGIGVSSPTAKLHIITQGSLSTDIAFKVRDATDTDDMVSINGAGNVLIGTNANEPSSKLTIGGNTQGFLPPRLSTLEKNGIISPAVGLEVYGTTLSVLSQYDGFVWNNYQKQITLTTIGTSGASTLIGNTLNIPQYNGGGGGAIGRHALLPLKSGDVTNSVIVGGSLSATAFAINRLTAYPFMPNQSFTSSNLFINIGAAAGSLSRIAIYSDLNGYPDSRLFVSADLDGSTLGLKTAVTSFSFVAGTTYWLAFHGGAIAGNTSSILAGQSISIKASPTTGMANCVFYALAFSTPTPTTFLAGQSFAVSNFPYIGITKA